uniref:Rhodanese domain-containing protein n=1 Tax=Arcella intermedia TaxID=1963864 RepID=A0A6B2LAQ4_9EUKA
MNKAESAKLTINRFNSLVSCVVHNVRLKSDNALQILKDYDIVLDCSDNVPTRYLVNDAAVLLKKPLVFGSALGFEGQCSVYNCGGGPCYRCIHPKPPKPETIGNCANYGVLGVVPGIIGSIQALEAIKLITGYGSVLSEKLLVFNSKTTQFLTIKLPRKKINCAICGENPQITSLQDYEAFTGCPANDRINIPALVPTEKNISVAEYYSIVSRGERHILLDVRQPHQYAICSLVNAENIPLAQLSETYIQNLKQRINNTQMNHPVYVICRRGIDSQRAVNILTSFGINSINISGGVTEWSKAVDPTFPLY